VLGTLCALGLGAAVVAAVHHAEVIAHRVGEPFGTLVLALAVTVIEASLLLSMMLAGGEEMAVLPRDTIYAAVMIICNGVVGICLLVGGLAHREQSFRIEGNAAGMAASMRTGLSRPTGHGGTCP
jgi:Ca2+:H+ antiporter